MYLSMIIICTYNTYMYAYIHIHTHTYIYMLIHFHHSNFISAGFAFFVSALMVSIQTMETKGLGCYQNKDAPHVLHDFVIEGCETPLGLRHCLWPRLDSGGLQVRHHVGPAQCRATSALPGFRAVWAAFLNTTCVNIS